MGDTNPPPPSSPPSPMAFLLERAKATPSITGKPVTEVQIWTAIEDNQRAVRAEHSNAPSYVQQYLVERRAFIEIWGTDELASFPGPKSHDPSAKSKSSVTPSPSKPPPTSLPPAIRGSNITSSALGVSHVQNASTRELFPSHAPRGPRDGGHREYRQRSRSPRRRDGPYRGGRERGFRSRSRSRSPRREARRDSRSQDRSHYLSWLKEVGYRSPPRPSLRGPSPPPQRSVSWQQQAEEAATGRMNNTSRDIARRYTFPGSEARDQIQPWGFLKPPASGPGPKAHIDSRTNRPYPPLVFSHPTAFQKIVGHDGDVLSDFCKHFRAVVFQVDVSTSPSMSAESVVTVWLEIKTYSDEKDDGVKRQIDGCRRGLELYHKNDHRGLQNLVHYYHANVDEFKRFPKIEGQWTQSGRQSHNGRMRRRQRGSTGNGSDNRGGVVKRER